LLFRQHLQNLERRLDIMQKCPTCGSGDIEVRADKENMRSYYHCANCGKRWSRAGFNRNGADVRKITVFKILPVFCVLGAILLLVLPLAVQLRKGKDPVQSVLDNVSQTTQEQTEGQPPSEEAATTEGGDGSEAEGDPAEGTEAVPVGAGDEKTSEAETEPLPSDFKVYYINVGQGDASLVMCDGHAMLIDGGPGSQAATVRSFLEVRKVKHLDYVIATHPDEEHIGGLVGALDYATAGKVLSPVKEDDGASFKELVSCLDRQNVEVTVPKAGDRFSVGGAEVVILGPTELSEEENNNSIILKVSHGDNSFLFAGDAETEEEELVMGSGADVKSLVLMVAHHGNASSTGAGWLDAVRPSFAVISCGEGNGQGCPSQAVLNRIKAGNITLFRTDLQGFLKVYEEDGRLVFRTEQNAEADVFSSGTVAGNSAG
jgi:competence protein ComEC